LATATFDAYLVGQTYYQLTVFPSGNPYDTPPWGLLGNATPWAAGMIPTPEPTTGLMLAVGGLALSAMGRRS